MPLELSPDGAARYEAMLGPLQEAVVRRGRVRRSRRRIANGVGTVAILALVVIGITSIQRPDAAPRITDSGKAPSVSDPATPTIAPDSTRVAIEYVETEPGVLARYRAADTVDVSRYTVSDYKVVEILHDIGRPTGIIRKGEHVRLTAAVTDAALNVSPPSNWRPLRPHSSRGGLQGM